MLGCQLFLAAFVGLVAYATYAFYQLPVPEDFEEPNQFRLMTAIVSISGYFVRNGCFGLGLRVFSIFLSFQS